MSDQRRAIVRRLIDEVMNGAQLDALDELCMPELATRLRRWIAPFQASFPDMRMDTIDLIAEGPKVVGRFRCSATHLGEWRGHAASGASFDEAMDLDAMERVIAFIAHLYDVLEWTLPPEEYERTVGSDIWRIKWKFAEKIQASLRNSLNDPATTAGERGRLEKLLKRYDAMAEHKRTLDQL